jgi:hypothetical protein
MLTDQTRWSLGHGKPLVPSRWQATPVDLGWFAVRTPLHSRERFVLVSVCAGGELLVGSSTSGPGGRGESLRRSHGDAAGVEPGASPVDRTAVNVGTARGCSSLGSHTGGMGWG